MEGAYTMEGRGTGNAQDGGKNPKDVLLCALPTTPMTLSHSA